MKKIDTMTLSPVEVYFKVVKGELKKFPNGYLDKEACKEILRYVCLNIHKLSREQICHINQQFLQDNFIGGFRKKFCHNVFLLVTYSFPELEIKPWEASRVPEAFWNSKENQKDFVLWVAKKENLDLNKLDDVSKLTSKVFAKYGGAKARRAAGGTFELIATATGNTFKEWEVLKIDIWTEAKAIQAVKWLIEKKLCWTDDQVRAHLNASIFRKNYLGGMLKNYCNNSPFVAVNLAYPGKFERSKFYQRAI